MPSALPDGEPWAQFYITAVTLDQMSQHAITDAPDEVCGFLAGKKGVASFLLEVPNIAQQPERAYLMEPLAQLRAMLAVEDHGMDVLAVYHSHPPASRSDPSPKDVQEWEHTNWQMVIVVPSVNLQSAVVRAFRVSHGIAQETPVVPLMDPG